MGMLRGKTRRKSRFEETAEKMVEKKLRSYIIPNVLAMTGTSCYVLADTFFISMAQGANGITALNLALPVYGLMFAIGSMIGIGSATRYSLRRALDPAEADGYFSNSLFWALLASLPFAAAGLWFPDAVLRWMGADEVILGVGLTYMRIALCFAPCFMLNYTFTAFVRNDGAPNVAMAATLTSGIFNIVFDYVLMFPLGMGMAGAALATGLSPVVSMLICSVHFFSPSNHIRLVRRAPSVRRLVRSCSLGIVALVGEMSSGITTMVFNFILLGLAGNIVVAAYGVVANAALVGTALLNGVSQGLQPYASEMHGKADVDAQRRIYRHSMQIALGIAALLVVLAGVFAGPLVSVFNSEGSAQLAAYATVGMRLYFLGFPGAAVNVVRAGFFSATGRGMESSVIAVLRGVVAVTVFAFVLSRAFGIIGVWLAFPVSEVFTWALTGRLLFRDAAPANGK